MEINARLWVLNLSDGEHSLLDIAERSGIPFSAISEAAELLVPEAACSRSSQDDGRGSDSSGEASQTKTARKVHSLVLSISNRKIVTLF